MADNSSNRKSIDAISLTLASLTVLFIAFKLAKVGDVANWPWFWVLSPVWVPVAFVLLILAVAGLIWVVASIVEYIRYKKRRNKSKRR